MSTPSIARYLREFGPGGEVAGPERAAQCRSIEIDAAFARGVESGQAAARASLELTLQEQKRQFETRLTAEGRAREEEAAKLAAALAAGLVSVERTIANAVGRLLRPFLAARVEAQVLADLHAALAALLRREPGITLTISGPEHLLAAFRAALPEAAISYLPNASSEIRVSSNDSILETRLGAWLAGLEEAGH